MRDETAYLRHILDSISKIERYTKGGRKRFLADTMIQDAVIRNLEIVGEAARNLSAGYRRRHPELPWPKIVALRNVLAHEYFGVDLDIVWEVVRRRLPPLKRAIAAMLKEHG